ncbi:MAG: CPBP family glutamic-type intramembrane protease [Leptolyngbyaceae bacterium]|nr:CPBP family glutamic-type intramembrane protease [Leptolyngbyaceae bacterium]
MPIWTILGDRLLRSLTAIPTLTDWLICLGLLISYGAIALPVGFWTKLLTVEWVTDWRRILTNTIVAFIFPSVIEEILFRVLPLPHPSSSTSWGAIALWSVGSLIIFILAHPLNALLVMTSRRDTFFDGSFLTLAGLLGVVCTVSYLQSGSLWPPVMLHWVIVVLWLVGLGGDRRMTQPT